MAIHHHHQKQDNTNHHHDEGDDILKGREVKLKHFLIAMLIILAITVPFFIITGRIAAKWDKYLQNNGKETMAFYAYSMGGGRTAKPSFLFEFKVAGESYTSDLDKAIEVPPDYPFEEIPIMVRYAEAAPNRNIPLPDKPFTYKGYDMKWTTHPKSLYYYLLIKKHHSKTDSIAPLTE